MPTQHTTSRNSAQSSGRNSSCTGRQFSSLTCLRLGMLLRCMLESCIDFVSAGSLAGSHTIFRDSRLQLQLISQKNSSSQWVALYVTATSRCLRGRYYSIAGELGIALMWVDSAVRLSAPSRSARTPGWHSCMKAASPQTRSACNSHRAMSGCHTGKASTSQGAPPI